MLNEKYIEYIAWYNLYKLKKYTKLNNIFINMHGWQNPKEKQELKQMSWSWLSMGLRRKEQIGAFIKILPFFKLVVDSFTYYVS